MLKTKQTNVLSFCNLYEIREMLFYFIFQLIIAYYVLMWPRPLRERAI